MCDGLITALQHLHVCVDSWHTEGMQVVGSAK